MKSFAFWQLRVGSEFFFRDFPIGGYTHRGPRAPPALYKLTVSACMDNEMGQRRFSFAWLGKVLFGGVSTHGPRRRDQWRLVTFFVGRTRTHAKLKMG